MADSFFEARIEVLEDELEKTECKLERVEKQLEIALSSMRDSRELFYQLSQIVVADAIGKQLKEIKDLEKC